MKRLLVVDDDPQIRRVLRTGLGGHGYDVRTAPNGETALETLANEPVDVVLLDLGLPGIDGMDVLRRLRGWTDVPVVVLSVRESQDEKVAALDAGADDYVVKPFGMPELVARLRAVRRRARSEPNLPRLRFGDLEVDLEASRVRLAQRDLHLTPTELRLLEAFVGSPGKLLTHAWLLTKVWGPGYGTESHYLRVYVQQLRRKLRDDPARPRFIVTETGLGYRWLPEPD